MLERIQPRPKLSAVTGPSALPAAAVAATSVAGVSAAPSQGSADEMWGKWHGMITYQGYERTAAITSQIILETSGEPLGQEGILRFPAEDRWGQHPIRHQVMAVVGQRRQRRAPLVALPSV